MPVQRIPQVILIVLGLLLVGVPLAVWLAWPRIEAWGVGIHQKSVTRELAKWADEDSVITDDASAIRAAGVVHYMSYYYVPGEGYRGPAAVEAALESQRRESIARIVEALERHTGLNYGNDTQRWSQWAEERKEQLILTADDGRDISAVDVPPLPSE